MEEQRANHEKTRIERAWAGSAGGTATALKNKETTPAIAEHLLHTGESEAEKKKESLLPNPPAAGEAKDDVDKPKKAAEAKARRAEKFAAREYTPGFLPPRSSGAWPECRLNPAMDTGRYASLS